MAEVEPSTSQETGNAAPEKPSPAIPAGMSKTQWKKQCKMNDKKEKWKKKKEEAKKKKREKRIEEREKSNSLEAPPTKRARLDAKGEVSVRRKYNKMSDPCASSVSVAVDCSFEDLMCDGDQLRLIKQVQRCFAANRRSPSPFQFYVTSYCGQMKAMLDGMYPVTKEHEHWDIRYRDQNYLEVFGKENIVYLLAESPNILNELDETKAYIIGGLVDHNHHKGHCHQLAQERGLSHARLPIAEFIQLSSRKVLTINHVFEILLRWSTNGGNWKEAFHNVIPQRKIEAPALLTEKISSTETTLTNDEPDSSTSSPHSTPVPMVGSNGGDPMTQDSSAQDSSAQDSSGQATE